MAKRGHLYAVLVVALSLSALICASLTALVATKTPVLPTATPQPTKTATPTPDPTEAIYVPTFEPIDCPFRVPEGATVECGFVDVPEDRSGDLTDTIRLPVAVYRSSSDTPAPDPVIYLQGGPGSGSGIGAVCALI